MSNKLPAGRYYIGDPCYVINDWDRFCQRWFSEDEGTFDYDGREVCVFSTQWGDGSYDCTNGAVLGVDAGLIGAIPADLMTTGGYEDGTEVYFDAPFECGKSDNGRLHFGSISVMTGDEDEDDEEECEYCGGQCCRLDRPYL